MKYFGSVRFFKNLILLFVVVLILAPTLCAVRKHLGLKEVERQVATMEQELERMNGQLSALEQQSEELENALEETVQDVKEQEEKEGFSAEVPGYQYLYPDFYAPEREETEPVWVEGMIYLTFDDGPTSNTDTVLQILAEKDVKATFFVTGPQNAQSDERLRAIVEQGHTLGMHTYCHDYEIIYESVEAFLKDMYQVFTMIREATGEPPTVFRFAGGSINGHNRGIHQELMAEMLRRGFVPYDWNVSAQDATAQTLSVEEVIRNVMGSAVGKQRGIVLLHDGGYQKTTAQALGTIIDRFREQGYQFDRIHTDTQPILFSYE